MFTVHNLGRIAAVVFFTLYLHRLHALQCTGITSRMYSCVAFRYIVLVMCLALLYQDTLAAPLDSDDGVSLSSSLVCLAIDGHFLYEKWKL